MPTGPRAIVCVTKHLAYVALITSRIAPGTPPQFTSKLQVLQDTRVRWCVIKAAATESNAVLAPSSRSMDSVSPNESIPGDEWALSGQLSRLMTKPIKPGVIKVYSHASHGNWGLSQASFADWAKVFSSLFDGHHREVEVRPPDEQRFAGVA